METATTETIPITTERTEKFLNDLNKQSTAIATCTELLKTLTTHFTSLQSTLTQRTQTLNSKLQSLDSLSSQTLSSLSLRESEIPGRESAARDRIEAGKQSALFRITQNFDNNNNNSYSNSVSISISSGSSCSSSNVKLSDWLREYARRMDGPGLVRFVVMKRKESVVSRTEIGGAVLESAVDPPRLVLDAVEEFVGWKRDKIGVSNERWACGMLVQGVFPEGRYVGEGGEREGGPVFARSIVDRAVRVLEMWRGEEVEGTVEAIMFLQLVAGFGVKERFDEEFLRKIVVEHSGKKDMAKLAIAVGFGHKIGGMFSYCHCWYSLLALCDFVCSWFALVI